MKKYQRCKKYGQGGKVSDIDREVATKDLKDKLKSKIKEGDDVIHFAYTDYGGDFIDKVAIDYFIENYPDNIVYENTIYFGRNAFVFGEPASRWIEETENYPLGFDDFESYYYQAENEATNEAFEHFIDSALSGYVYDRDEVLDALHDKFDGYFSLTTQGLDYSESKLLDYLTEEDLIKKEEYASGGEIHKKDLFSEQEESYAKGGLLEHGLKEADKIIDSFNNVVVVENEGKKYVVNLNTGQRWTDAEWYQSSKTDKLSKM